MWCLLWWKHALLVVTSYVAEVAPSWLRRESPVTEAAKIAECGGPGRSSLQAPNRALGQGRVSSP